MIDHGFVTLEYKHSVLLDDDEPSCYIKDLEGHVVVNFDRRRQRAGRFRIFVIDAELAINDEASLFDVFDTHAATIGFWSLYRSEMTFKSKVVRLLPEGDRLKPNMLILDRMEILPKYRGRGIGLRALRCLQRQFSTGCGIVAMKPFPLQFEGGSPEENKDNPTFVKLGLDAFDNDFRRATTKLRAYYAHLGFVRVPGTEYMVADPLLTMPLDWSEPPRSLE